MKRFTRLPIYAPAMAAIFAAIVVGAVASGPSAGHAAVGVVYLLLSAAWPGIVFTLAAIGLGRAFATLAKSSRDPILLQAGLGLGLMFTISHALGALGLVEGRWARAVAAAPLVIGLVLLAHQLWVSRRAIRIPDAGPWWFAVLPLGLLLVAACSPPGWLWASEGNGYDVLSYHLQLPQEWFAAGRLRPFEHNVYSWLPGYAEAAYLHVMVATGMPRTAAPGATATGVLAGDGAIACQMLHACFTLLACWSIARAARTAARDAEVPAGFVPLLASLVLATPWTMVVGSLAYNEMPMLAMGAAAFACAVDERLGPRLRATQAALLVGFACGVKPTALFLVGLPVAILLAAGTPARRWLACAIPAAVVGVLALAPWLFRNACWGSNPFFPFGAGVFGPAHWSGEQVGRFAAAHRFEGGISDRFITAFHPIGADARGLLHTQWGVFFPLVLVAAVIALRRAPRRGAVALGAAGAGLLLAWLFTTHVQSRFLLPALIPGTMLLGLWLRRPGASAAAKPGRHAWPVRAIALAIVAQSGFGLWVFFRERGGQPAALIPLGMGFLTGDSFAPSDASGSRPICNRVIGPRDRLYLIGGTPLHFTCPIVYHTTYDASPLGLAITAHPDDPDAWTRELVARGITHALIDERDLARLRASDRTRPGGWYDPAVTHERLGHWLDRVEVVRSWPEAGQILVQLRPRGGSP